MKTTIHDALNRMRERAGPDVAVRDDRRRGRAASSNATGRFDKLARVVFDDGWTGLEELPPFRTHVTVERPKSIIARNQSPDIAFDRSVNPYRGCEHGCVYCFARPTARVYGIVGGPRFREPAVRQAGRGEGFSNGNCRGRAISRAPFCSAPIPILISRSSAVTASRARSWRCWSGPAIRSASSRNRIW